MLTSTTGSAHIESRLPQPHPLITRICNFVNDRDASLRPMLFLAIPATLSKYNLARLDTMALFFFTNASRSFPAVGRIEVA